LHELVILVDGLLELLNARLQGWRNLSHLSH